MKILLTGANGYIGKRLLPVLLKQGHEVICCVRNKTRLPLHATDPHPNMSVMEIDFLNTPDTPPPVENVDVAYYLVHSMSSNSRNFEQLEVISVKNFLSLAKQLSVKQIIYLSGITNSGKLSKHLSSRKRIEDLIIASGIPFTVLKAGIIVGSGSASFEIIRDLVEKLPVMIAPKWLNTPHQPIAIRNVIEYLTRVILRPETLNKSFDIGGPDVLTYKEMLMQFAGVRGLKRFIITVPVMTPRLSSYWLYFVTATSYNLAVNLVNSMKVKVVAANNELEKLLHVKPVSYREAVRFAFQKIEHNTVISSWKDSLVSSYSDNTLFQHVAIPVNGCNVDKRTRTISGDVDRVLEKIWSIGGETGWYYASRLWELRGFLDKIFGGVGLRRGRTNANTINAGDTLDFWRVLAADRQNMRLLLYAEMKLPGEAWLEFRITNKNNTYFLTQTATFRPKGLTGRIYWHAVMPLHFLVFKGMADRLAE
jgi:uncharacterized protein YbjT (DUF2867 family)